MTTFTESELEAAALEWLEGLGWRVTHGLNIAPHADGAERADYSEVVLEHRLRRLGRLNPHLPAEALDDAYRKIARPEGSTLEARKPRVPPPARGGCDRRVPDFRGHRARRAGFTGSGFLDKGTA